MANNQVPLLTAKLSSTKTISQQLCIDNESLQTMRTLLQKHPLQHRDRLELYHNSKSYICHKSNSNKPIPGAAVTWPYVPLFSSNNMLIEFRKSLSIWHMRDEIVKEINANQVVIVYGKTGSGKTTQLPQFILEYSNASNIKCRVLCTQTNQVVVSTVAERVATERGENLGQAVGYILRLESCAGPKTVLTYCTHEVLLRKLINGSESLEFITHIIVDEIHLRNQFADVLLIFLQNSLIAYPHLKLILMSATKNIDLFRNYFRNSSVICIPQRSEKSYEFYLDDIKKLIDDSCNNSRLTEQANDFFTKNFENGGNGFGDLIQCVLRDEVSVHYQYSDTGCTGLMAASNNGNNSLVKEFPDLGVDVDKCSALEWAAFNHTCSSFHNTVSNSLQYHKNDFEDDSIDCVLLVRLIRHIHLYLDSGNIMVFLPDYSSILKIKQRISEMLDLNTGHSKYKLYVLHKSMATSKESDIRGVFVPEADRRKIILTTNIAESGIAISDITYVIDCGKIREQSYDYIVGRCKIDTSWISKECADLRTSRIGLTQFGMCFRLYTCDTYRSLQEFSTPEILKKSLERLFLQVKMLAPNVLITDFISQAPTPLMEACVQKTIASLKNLGALNMNEELTPLGQHLADFSLDPHLGKLLLFSIIFKCMDPILTLVSCLAEGDLFIIPNSSSEYDILINKQKEFSCCTYSDHVVILRAFQFWQEGHTQKKDYWYFVNNGVSYAGMDRAVVYRAELLSQLRAGGYIKAKPPNDIKDINANSSNWAVVKATVVASRYPNIAYVDKLTGTVYIRTEANVSFDPSSVLSFRNDYWQGHHSLPTNWAVYEEKICTLDGCCQVHTATAITQMTVALFSSTDKNISFMDFSNNEKPFICLDVSSGLIKDFVQKCQAVFLRKIRYPYKPLYREEEDILAAMVKVLTVEENVANLYQPPGIGIKPKSVMADPRTVDTVRAENTKINTSFSKDQVVEGCVNNILPFGLGVCENDFTENGGGKNTDSLKHESLLELINIQPLNTLSNQSFNTCALELEGVANGAYPVCQVQPPNNIQYTDFYSQYVMSRFSLLPESVYVIIKATGLCSIETSMNKKSWIFSPQTECKLKKLIAMGKEVICIFTVQATNCFQGVARLKGGPTQLGSDIPACPIEWYSRCDIPYSQTKNLLNPFNEYRRVYMCSDGQEVESSVAIILCKMFLTQEPAIPEQNEHIQPFEGRPILGRRM